MKTVLVVLLLMVAASVFAQGYRDISVGGEFLIRLRVGIGNQSLDERAGQLDTRIAEVLSLRNLKDSDIVKYQKGNKYEIRVRGKLLVVVTPEDAAEAKMSLKKLAEQWTNQFKKKLPNLTPGPRQSSD